MEYTRQNKAQPVQAKATAAKPGVVAYAPPEPFAGKETVQREVVESVHVKNQHHDAAVDYEKRLDNAVDKSFMHVISAPKLGISVDGHTDKWAEDWDNHIKGKKVDLFAASFGYAIESLATNIYLPPPPGGYTLALQAVRENTRPDVVLLYKGDDAAWLDITAKNSQGHIWDKGPPYWKQANHASEIAYPSLDNGYLTMMEKNKDNEKPKGFDANAFKKQLEMAQKLATVRNERWNKIGYTIYNIWGSKKFDYGYRRGDINQMLNRQTPMMLILDEYFGLGLSKQIARYEEDVVDCDDDIPKHESDDAARLRVEVPHILKALGFNSVGAYGYLGGSKNRGRSWLLQFDKGVPQLNDLFGDSGKDKKKDVDMVDKEKTKTNTDKMVIDNN